MCLGSAPQAPKIVQTGPSKAEIAAQKQAMQQYQLQAQRQQQAYQEQLRNQITLANDEAARRQRQLEADAAALAAQERAGAYVVSSAVESDPAKAQTTTAVVPKEKPMASLKINTAGVPSAAGAGLNIGV